MAPRRANKTVKAVETNNFANLKLLDVRCPICRSILIEPVTLPCNHEFCLSCFHSTMENTNLVCPLCRVRIGSWLRAAKKEKKLVNILLWKAIKETFSQEVTDKLNGVDNICQQEVPSVRIATPGAIHLEYEEEKRRTQLEIQKQQEAEAKASEELIKKLKEQEQREEELRQQKIRQDEELARQLAKDLNSSATKASCSKLNVSGAAKKQESIDRFFMNKASAASNFATKEFTARILRQDPTANIKTAEGNITNNVFKHIPQTIKLDKGIRHSSDSIGAECCYFKSIDHRNIPPSKTIPFAKIIPKKVLGSLATVIRSPTGQILFKHNEESPFISLRTISTSQKDVNILKVDQTVCDNLSENTLQKKEILMLQEKNVSRNDERYQRSSQRKRFRVDYKEVLYGNKKEKKQNSVINRNPSPKKSEIRPISPPFYGFSCDDKTNKSSVPSVEEMLKKKIEAQDFELAKKLQEELNRQNSRYHTRNKKSNIKINRQMTIDDMIPLQALK